MKKKSLFVKQTGDKFVVHSFVITVIRSVYNAYCHYYFVDYFTCYSCLKQFIYIRRIRTNTNKLVSFYVLYDCGQCSLPLSLGVSHGFFFQRERERKIEPWIFFEREREGNLIFFFFFKYRNMLGEKEIKIKRGPWIATCFFPKYYNA